MVVVRKFYLWPRHAVRVFERVVQEHTAPGHSLSSLTKGFVLGSGVSLWFEFAETPETADHMLTYFYGRRRMGSNTAFQGWQVVSALPMRTLWIPLGYYYHLKREHEHAV